MPAADPSYLNQLFLPSREIGELIMVPDKYNDPTGTFLSLGATFNASKYPKLASLLTSDSENGYNLWTAARNGSGVDAAPYYANSIAYGNGIAVAINTSTTTNKAVYVSTDYGVSWTGPYNAGLPNTSFISYVSFLNLFIATNGTTSFAYSSNGVSWTVRSTAYAMGAITSNTSYAVAGGWATTYMWYSTNGISWTSVAVSTSSYTGCLVWTGTHFVALGGCYNSAATSFYSTTGTSWTLATLPVSATWRRIIVDSSSRCLAVGVGYGYLASFSTSTLTWTQTGVLPNTEALDICKFGSTYLLTTGTGGSATATALYASTDLSNWTKITTGFEPHYGVFTTIFPLSDRVLMQTRNIVAGEPVLLTSSPVKTGYKTLPSALAPYNGFKWVIKAK